MRWFVAVYMALVPVCVVLSNLYTSSAIHTRLRPVMKMVYMPEAPAYTETAHAEPQTRTSTRRLILAFPYNGERVPVARRLAESPHALVVVSEWAYGHNGLMKAMHWHADFRTQTAEYVRLTRNLYNQSSHQAEWQQENAARTLLGEGVRNLHARGEISDNDVVVVTDADEVVSPEALAWLQAHLEHDVVAVAGFRWFLWTHCHEHPRSQDLKVATTVQTLRVNLNWDAQLVRKREHGLRKVSISVADAGSHCSWCFGTRGIREKMRVNIETSSWVSHGAPRAYSDSELDRLRATGAWFDGKLHGPGRCSPAELAREMALQNAL